MATRDPNLWYTKPDGTNVYYNQPSTPAASAAPYKVQNASPMPVLGAAPKLGDLGKQVNYGAPIWMNPLTMQLENIPGRENESIIGAWKPGITPSQVTQDVAAKQVAPGVGNPGSITDKNQPGFRQVTPYDPGFKVGPATGGNAAGAPAGLDPYLKSYLDKKMAREDEVYGQYQDLYKQMQGRANPHNTNSDAFKSLLKQRQETSTRAFNGAERAYMSRVAGGRGMGGYDAAGLANLVGARSRGYADVTNNTFAETMDKAQAFDNAKQSGLASVLAAMNGDASGLATSLANLDAAERRTSLDRLDRQNGMDQQTLALLLSSAPQLAKLLLGGL